MSLCDALIEVIGCIRKFEYAHDLITTYLFLLYHPYDDLPEETVVLLCTSVCGMILANSLYVIQVARHIRAADIYSINLK